MHQFYGASGGRHLPRFLVEWEQLHFQKMVYRAVIVKGILVHRPVIFKI